MTLVAAHMEVAPPPFVKVVRVTSAADMAEAILPVAAEYDCIIKAAAVSDYTPVATSTEKIKKTFGWTPKTHIDEALEMVVSWTKVFFRGNKEELREITDEQIRRFFGE